MPDEEEYEIAAQPEEDAEPVQEIVRVDSKILVLEKTCEILKWTSKGYQCVSNFFLEILGATASLWIAMAFQKGGAKNLVFLPKEDDGSLKKMLKCLREQVASLQFFGSDELWREYFWKLQDVAGTEVFFEHERAGVLVPGKIFGLSNSFQIDILNGTWTTALETKHVIVKSVFSIGPKKIPHPPPFNDLFPVAIHMGMASFAVYEAHAFAMEKGMRKFSFWVDCYVLLCILDSRCRGPWFNLLLISEPGAGKSTMASNGLMLVLPEEVCKVFFLENVKGGDFLEQIKGANRIPCIWDELDGVNRTLAAEKLKSAANLRTPVILTCNPNRAPVSSVDGAWRRELRIVVEKNHAASDEIAEEMATNIAGAWIGAPSLLQACIFSKDEMRDCRDATLGDLADHVAALLAVAKKYAHFLELDDAVVMSWFEEVIARPIRGKLEDMEKEGDARAWICQSLIRLADDNDAPWAVRIIGNKSNKCKEGDIKFVMEEFLKWCRQSEERRFSIEFIEAACTGLKKQFPTVHDQPTLTIGKGKPRCEVIESCHFE